MIKFGNAYVIGFQDLSLDPLIGMNNIFTLIKKAIWIILSIIMVDCTGTVLSIFNNPYDRINRRHGFEHLKK